MCVFAGRCTVREKPHNVLRPQANIVFMQNNVLLMIVIAVPGQLIGQLVAARDAVHFLELLVVPYHFCVAPALLLETTGIMHCAYVLKDGFAWWSDVEVDHRTLMRKTTAYHVKSVVSVAVVLFCGVVVTKGILAGQTHASNGAGWDHLPHWTAFLLFLLFMVIIGGCEGLQISAVKLNELPPISDQTRSVQPSIRVIRYPSVDVCACVRCPFGYSTMIDDGPCPYRSLLTAWRVP
jgi:hypothetical protein